MQKFRNKKLQLVLLTVLTLVLVGGLAYQAKHNSTSPKPEPTQSPTPKPGQPGNPGDEAKTSVNKVASSSPSPTSQSSPAVLVTDFTVTPNTGGTVKVANQVNGVKEGSCSLNLTSPSGQTKQFTGSVGWSGTYYFCHDFGTITGITESGTWSANLSAGTSTPAKTTFEVK